MKRDELKDLAAFMAIAEAQSFTFAAAKLGMSPSALSHSTRGLEERLGVRLLARSTRSVRPTEAGDRLLRVLQPALADIEAELAVLKEARGRPAGSVRLTTSKYAATSILEPVLPGFLEAYPDVRVEVTVGDDLRSSPTVTSTRTSG